MRNCGGFYVYELGPAPTCHLRYCAERSGHGGTSSEMIFVACFSRNSHREATMTVLEPLFS